MRSLTSLRSVAGVFVLLAMLAGPPAMASEPQALPAAYERLLDRARDEGSVRVLVTTVSMGHQRSLAESLGRDARVLTSYDLFPILLVEAGEEGLLRLIQDPRSESIRLDRAQPPTLASTLPVINGDDVQGLGFDGSGTAVAILDTGIDRDHPFFTGRLVSEACFSNAAGAGTGNTLCPGGGTNQTGAGSADADIAICYDGTANICDHGSHVAGIAAGDAAGDPMNAPGNGVAPNADIIAVQVFTRFNSAADCAPNAAPCVLTFQSDQILGLQQALALDGTLASDVVAANMSLGGGMNATACDGDPRKPAIDALLAANIATVISSGNNGFLGAVGAPGCISTAVTVGSTTDADAVSGFSNRGALLDVFAPGSGVISSIIDDTYGSKNGTSMAAPHVTGAWGILREIYPTASVATILGWLQANGVPITYASTSGNVTTPRIDLLATIQPVVDADQGLVTVDEGQTATNTGTFTDPNGDTMTLSASVGTVTDTGGGTWSWSFDTIDGPSESQTVTITATDATGVSGEATFDLVVSNVAPTVTGDPAQVTKIDEGDTVSVTSSFSDPGAQDHPYTATVDWGHSDLGSDPATVVLTSDGPPGPDVGTASASKQYGDNGGFTVTTTVTDKDGDSGFDDFVLTVRNVDPTAEIDETGTVLVNGVPTIIANAGDPVDFTGRSSDPGSDDLTFDWDFDDGNTATGVSLVNDPLLDPFPSPTVQPRVDIEDMQTNTFGDACVYQPTLDVTDDDGGASPTDSIAVIIAGNAGERRGAGYWHHQYKGNGKTDFDDPTLECYLEITGFMSTVFHEETDVSTIGQAESVLFGGTAKSDMRKKVDRHLLTAWLNFANGAIGLGTLVDTDGDSVPDTAFGDVLAAAEAVRLNPAATKQQLEAQKDLLERINEGLA